MISRVVSRLEYKSWQLEKPSVNAWDRGFGRVTDPNNNFTVYLFDEGDGIDSLFYTYVDEKWEEQSLISYLLRGTDEP